MQLRLCGLFTGRQKFPLRPKLGLLWLRVIAAGKPERSRLPKAGVLEKGKKWRIDVDEETFNLSIRKFLKMVGVKSQHEIKQAVAKAISTGAISGTEPLSATMTLEIAGLTLDVKFHEQIRLQ